MVPHLSRHPHTHEYVQLSPVKNIAGLGQGCYSCLGCRDFYSLLMGIPKKPRSIVERDKLLLWLNSYNLCFRAATSNDQGLSKARCRQRRRINSADFRLIFKEKRIHEFGRMKLDEFGKGG